jgi:UPF0176 protein
MTDLTHSAFYKFTNIADPALLCRQLRALCKPLLGSILIAKEGINGTVAGLQAQITQFETALVKDPRFAGMHFKHSQCRTKPFARMKVHHKPQIVLMGVDGVDAIAKTGVQVRPEDWRALIHQEDVVLIDNRNSFEYRLGHFQGALNPQVRHFRDFPAYIESELPAWRAGKKRIAMYCTGGIRCEKSSAWMLDLGLEVFQLEGGILNYFERMKALGAAPIAKTVAKQEPKPADDFVGDCFVFDNRIALNHALEETGASLQDVYAAEPDGAWRIARAQRLLDATDLPDDS